MKITFILLGAIFINSNAFSQNQFNNPKNQLTMNIKNEPLKETNFNFPYQLPSLTYAYEALEPYIDKETMVIHYTKHHQSYIDNLNKALGETEIKTLSLGDLLKNISKYPMSIRNNGGGHYNHSLFWQILSPMGGTLPDGKLHDAINKQFGSFEVFKTQFSDAAKTRFGSGWAWLSVDENKQLFVSSTPNQDNPLMDVVDKQGVPILGLDVWEHAYYLKYQNKRPDYIENFWKIINWQEVEKKYLELLK